MRSVALGALVAISSSLAHAQPAAIVAAVKARDADAFLTRIVLPLSVLPIEWVTPSCAKQFGGGHEVIQREVPALVACLGTLGLATSRKVPTVVYYGPRFHLTLRLDAHGKLAQLGTEIRVGSAPHVDYVDFAKRAVGTWRVAPTADDKRRVAAESGRFVSARVALCIDEKGEVTTPQIEPGVGGERYAEQIALAAVTWKAKPFVHGRTAIKACSETFFVYPEALRQAALDDFLGTGDQ